MGSKTDFLQEFDWRAVEKLEPDPKPYRQG